MTAATTDPSSAAGWSMNRRAAETVCRHALDVADARAVLEELGLVDEGGRDLLADNSQVITSELLAVPLSGAVSAAVRRRPGRRTLTAELEELESTDPAVAAAATSYDRMVERITGRTLPEPRKEDHVPAAASPTEPPPILSLHIQERYTADDLVKLAEARRPSATTPPVDLLARGLDHPNPRVRKLARAAQSAVDQLVTALLAAR